LRDGFSKETTKKEKEKKKTSPFFLSLFLSQPSPLPSKKKRTDVFAGNASIFPIDAVSLEEEEREEEEDLLSEGGP